MVQIAPTPPATPAPTTGPIKAYSPLNANVDTSKNLWANQDLIDSICRVAEERRHGRSIPGTF